MRLRLAAVGGIVVKIALTNHNVQSQFRQAIINLETHTCLLDNKHTVATNHLIKGGEFTHPLLKPHFTPSVQGVYRYEYDDIDGLLSCAQFVYSILVHSDKPATCQFQLRPSEAFKRLKPATYMYFSMHRKKTALHTISLRQLQSLISDLGGYKFEFSDNIIIDASFTMQELPQSIDGDSLYQADEKILALLKSSSNFRAYELRYINPYIGLGVFSRELIKQGDIISFYSGMKIQHKPANSQYFFNEYQDCLKMHIDARQYGNITRFINHAPKPDTSLGQGSLLSANIESHDFHMYGQTMVGYVASRDIMPGEQLLIYYGNEFFNEANIAKFKPNGDPTISNKKFFKTCAHNKIQHIRIMAKHGVKKAHAYLLLRWFFIVTTVVVLAGILNYLV